jgi:hypothetical protein
MALMNRFMACPFVMVQLAVLIVRTVVVSVVVKLLVAGGIGGVILLVLELLLPMLESVAPRLAAMPEPMPRTPALAGSVERIMLRLRFVVKRVMPVLQILMLDRMLLVQIAVKPLVVVCECRRAQAKRHKRTDRRES